MNENLKCPFCKGELVGTIGHPICRNQDCVMCDDPMPQDLLEELIRTRKALDVAIRGLDQMTWGCDSTDAELLLKEIKEITALGL